VFSTTDGMALEVFVVDGWPTDEVQAFAPNTFILQTVFSSTLAESC
jgi:hypothetical protein